MTYILIFLIILYFVYYHDISGFQNNKENHLKFLFWIFFLITGLRHGIGGDTYQFRIFWDLLPTYEKATWQELDSFRYDKGWVLLCFIIKSTLGSFVFLQLFISYIFNKGLFKIVGRYSKYPFFVLLLFFYFWRTILPY